MNKPTSFVDELTGPELSIGTGLKSMSATTAEALGYSELDFLFIDRQHGSPVFSQLEEIVRATDLNDMPVAVRVPRDDTSMITYLLDIGVRGIILPQVETPERIKQASSHVRYADGRSLGSTTRAAQFGSFEKEAYAEYVNSDLALLPMIESKSGVKRAAELSSMEKVTALLIGPGDLAFSLETEFWSDRHLDAINEVFAACDTNDCPVGIFLSTEEQLATIADDISFMIFSNDVAITTSILNDVVTSQP